MDDATVERWREHFRFGGRVHLNNCSVPPRHARADEARRRYEREWRDGDPWRAWKSAVDDARARFASLVGAAPDEIAVLSSVSHALAQLACALPWQPGDAVVVGDAEFRAIPQFWNAFARRRDVEVRVARGRDGVVPRSAYADAMTDRTRLVCTAHVSPSTGGMVDAAALADEASARNARLVLDAYQSVGAVDVDVGETGVDALVSGARKFCLGAPGVAFLYLRAEFAAELDPATPGWLAFDGDGLRPGARRLEAGTPPATAAYETVAGLSLLDEVGIHAVSTRVAALAARLHDGALDRGFDVVTPADPDRRGPLVVVDASDPEGVVADLADRGVVASARGGVRVAPHFFTTEAEVDRALDALAAVGR